MPKLELIRRRALLAGPAAALLPGGGTRSGAARAAAGLPALDQQEWLGFKRRFLAPEGRVVDTGNNGISHSEGQGWGLLLAEAFGDRAAFDSLLAWTSRVLRRRGDALHAWRYRPTAAMPVEDPNNASDGDLFIAWALLRAAERWENSAYRHAAAGIARDIRRLLVREAAGRAVLLPGAAGFERPDRIILNPSYYAFGAIRALGRTFSDAAWSRLETDGIALLRAARFGCWSLPPDWLALYPKAAPGSELKLAEEWPARFSFDAVRVPLYLVWAGLGSEPAVASASAFWAANAHPWLPGWADLSARGGLAPYPAASGVAAVAALSWAQGGVSAGRHENLPGVEAATDYYSAALTLLARLAWREAGAAT